MPVGVMWFMLNTDMFFQRAPIVEAFERKRMAMPAEFCPRCHSCSRIFPFSESGSRV